MNSQKLLRILFLSSVLLVGCGKGYQASTSGSESDSNQKQNVVADPVQQQKAWDETAQNMNYSVENYPLLGKTFYIQVDRVRQSLIFVLPLASNYWPVAAFPVPKMPGATVEKVLRQDGGYSLGVVIPIKYLLKGAIIGNYNQLPNGNGLPSTLIGEIRGTSLSLPQQGNVKLHIYLAVNAAAVFIETPELKYGELFKDVFPVMPPVLFSFDFFNKDKTQQIGNLSVIPETLSANSGFYIASRIPRELVPVLDELLRF